jgi:hypothetical protein
MFEILAAATEVAALWICRGMISTPIITRLTPSRLRLFNCQRASDTLARVEKKPQSLSRLPS